MTILNLSSVFFSYIHFRKYLFLNILRNGLKKLQKSSTSDNAVKLVKDEYALQQMYSAHLHKSFVPKK